MQEKVIQSSRWLSRHQVQLSYYTIEGADLLLCNGVKTGGKRLLRKTDRPTLCEAETTQQIVVSQLSLEEKEIHELLQRNFHHSPPSLS